MPYCRDYSCLSGYSKDRIFVFTQAGLLLVIKGNIYHMGHEAKMFRGPFCVAYFILGSKG